MLTEPHPYSGKLIIVEGIDGSGKSTQLSLLHRWLPNTTQSFARILPGVAATTLLWLLGASLFAWYVGHLTDYSVYYGSLGGVAITLMFFYSSAVIFIFGAEFNAVWREQTGRRPAPQDAGSEDEDADG